MRQEEETYKRSLCLQVLAFDTTIDINAPLSHSHASRGIPQGEKTERLQ